MRKDFNNLYFSTLPSVESPYPILILCGPEGCGRVEISKKLVDDYPDYFDFVYVIWFESLFS